jgi:DNA-binding response OmpR family regulator
MKNTLMFVSPSAEEHGFLRTVLDPSNWTIYKARTCSEALALLRRAEIQVVVCERDLPDGGWKDLLDHVAVVAHAPCLIVTSRLADELLWAEVLNLGGYDVLAKPLDAEEVPRVIELAHQHWKDGSAKVVSKAASRGGE